ncbi:hypothetical protein L1077_20235 [Pseudoalteromonas luteoviolacea]|uniref:hypothetical protein n=1 Tax=Pseudoalteromonas luteoviolacea TaxID=43657 RepID=UPI001F179128|nr:hypothetical protein [Pseudoalteromonas luteoviolacea]MCF6441769.1 hypothetical protein [Pseudoalteromonas luteoviolacea]
MKFKFKKVALKKLTKDNSIDNQATVNVAGGSSYQSYACLTLGNNCGTLQDCATLRDCRTLSISGQDYFCEC